MATLEKNVLMIKKEKSDLIIEYPATKKECIVDFPANLPADGGNADTVDGKHAVDLQNYNNLTNKPSALVNPTSLKVQLNGGTTEGTNQITYDGSNAKAINVTAASVGAAASNHNHSGTYEPAFTKNNAFNKNFGTAAGTVCQGNDSRLSNSRPASDVSAWAKASTKPTYTKSEVGLGNVTDDAQVKRSEMGRVNGVATLDANGDLLLDQLPKGIGMDSSYNTFMGKNIPSNTSGRYSSAFGYCALKSNTATSNSAFGYFALSDNTSGSSNSAFGSMSLSSNTTGQHNAAFGSSSLSSNSTGMYNSAFGYYALKYNTSSSNSAFGYSALGKNTTAAYNSAFGNYALGINTTGDFNTALGSSALFVNTTGRKNTAVGSNALGNLGIYNNCSGLGYDSQVTGSDQIQLGDTNVTVYAQKALSVRSDARDKLDIKDSSLGLDFIMALTPREYILNPRERYQEVEEVAVINEETGEEEVRQVPKPIDYSRTNDGSKAGHRYHQGLVAQEVKEVLDDLGVDFAGYQDHKVTGGEDVLTLSYEEFISPMIKAMQEMQSEITDLRQQISKLGA